MLKPTDIWRERQSRALRLPLAMASQGLSSWLSGSKSEASDATDGSDSQPQDKSKPTASSSDSPLDISLSQLRAKETITRISPEKRSLVEEIDSEADDTEFDERAHWARRGSRKKARASRRAAALDKSQPSIALFCVKEKETAVDKQDANAEENPVTNAIAVSQSEKKESKNRSRKKKIESFSLELDSAMEDVAAVMSSGRPKRQAVVRAQILQQQQKLLDAVAARKNPTSFLTPPPATKKATAEGNATTSGRKRKLDMNKKKTSPPSKNGSTTSSPGANKAAQSFFLSEQEKKQMQEIEAVSLFREQLRQTREKDLAFFAGKTANPFFQARSTTKRSSSAENDNGVVEINEDGDSYEGKHRRGTTGGRWSKALPLFPRVQHVLTVRLDEEDMDTNTNDLIPPRKADSSVDVVVIEDDSAPDGRLSNEVMAQLRAAMNGQVCTESSFSEQFWFREYLDASSLPAEVNETIDVTSPRFENAEAAATKLAEKETLLIDELVEAHGLREKQVRELLEGLEQARAKRLDRKQNLSLVDRYLPVNVSGLVGNHESLHTLSSWLSAWKIGGGDSERLDCFASELFTFEDGDSDSEDEVGDLCRLFILEGESGSGKSAAVYACAEELGYEIIEINAAQNRSGKSVVELCGEATQSTRVLHIGGKDDKSKKKHKKKRRRQSEGRKSLEKPTVASLSLVLFEDVDLVFDDDKGFLNAVCSIAKHSKCPIVVTCAQLPDAFPVKPGRLCRELQKPSMDEFTTWMRLVAFIEGLQLAPSLINALGEFFERDVRRSLHFLEANLPVSDARTKTQWRWQHGDTNKEDEVSHVDVPAWTVWSTGGSSFDALTSNLLAELAAGEAESKKPEDKSRDEKLEDINAISELAQITDSASVADTWMTRTDDDIEDSFFLCERERLAALELRRSSLYMLNSSTSSLAASLMRSQGPSSSECVQRTLDSALEATRRRSHQADLARLKAKFELPLAYKGCGNSEPRFMLDYMPMVGRLLCGTGLQEGRRRTSRRNHYLGDVLGDMSVIDELPAFNTYLQVHEDQMVAASPASTQ
ncbi:ATPase family AAA domain-containing protein 5 [Phytophthora nicotianae]|uniref:ATPase family AAA domain-containing protein 5 n=1 Tax=Phytophthora nicotianae TaxID=4792 RepID=A0A0W8DHV8_PHYNI|nr:ATPase family AAA domain-containing protein 5 [Phytophthora nicotianae]